jgi:hypothetical protein
VFINSLIFVHSMWTVKIAYQNCFRKRHLAHVSNDWMHL